MTEGSAATREVQGIPRPWTFPRVALQLALWAGPLSVGVALAWFIISLSLAPAGREVPTAGDPATWAGVWGSVMLGLAGMVGGAVVNLAWLWAVLLRGLKPTAFEWARTVLHVSSGALTAILWSVG